MSRFRCTCHAGGLNFRVGQQLCNGWDNVQYSRSLYIYIYLCAQTNGRGLSIPGHWIPETGSCMAVEKRPTAPASSSPLLDFSKDSLNSTGLLERSVAAQQATPTRHVVDDDQDCTETVKLEPLAFTIDFGDVTPGKKKETPKRFAERLASTTTGHGKRAPSSSSSKAEVKKVIESQLRH